MSRGIAIFLAFLPLPLLAAAPPATAPATTQSALDQSSPKALMRSFFRSGGEADEAMIRALLHATNPLEQQILDSVVKIELANGRLRAAEKTKFGTATTRPSMTSPTIKTETAEQLDALTEKIEGEHATVTQPGDAVSVMRFVLVDGRWKLPIASLVGPIDPAMAETLATTTRAQIEIIDALTAEVASGKLSSEDQVRQELVRRFAERLAAATRSSTQPTAPPASAPPNSPPGT